jgi:hypothetical protein
MTPAARPELAAAIGEIACRLADRIDTLVVELLPAGRREGREWRAGSIAGEAGSSLGVHLVGSKRGIWADFATPNKKGDALDLVRAALGLGMRDAIGWSRRWLGIEDGIAEARRRLEPAATHPGEPEPGGPERWRYPWRAARPIAGSLAEHYLVARGLAFADPAGRVLRFATRRQRIAPAGKLECRPALLAQLCDVRTGTPCGIINIFLRPDGTDRLRDRKSKTLTGRGRGASVMLPAFDEPTMGLVVCEGVETGIAVHLSGLRPIWARGGAANLANFPLLPGIEALTVAADWDGPGMRAARAVAHRWRLAGRQASIVAPPAGDWADK